MGGAGGRTCGSHYQRAPTPAVGMLVGHAISVGVMAEVDSATASPHMGWCAPPMRISELQWRCGCPTIVHVRHRGRPRFLGKSMLEIPLGRFGGRGVDVDDLERTQRRLCGGGHEEESEQTTHLPLHPPPPVRRLWRYVGLDPSGLTYTGDGCARR